uniref:Sulfhydryl oxidase n=1 Tax=Dikerogammarus haemobaphes virus 1 TaxID=2704946 RepID=A0A6G9HDF3_9VIRU|nr:sulfhydryl/thiol Oxidoreductase (ERV1/ALR/poxvirus E10 family) [Dikerogammarus haemobaphes virus 1]
MDWRTKCGPVTWRVLHALAAKFSKHSELERVVFGILNTIPCTSCRVDSLRAWNNKPIDSRIEFFLFNLHNSVNAKLGRPSFPIKHLAMYYTPDNLKTIFTRDLFVVNLVSESIGENWLGIVTNDLFTREERLAYSNYKNKQNLQYLRNINL